MNLNRLALPVIVLLMTLVGVAVSAPRPPLFLPPATDMDDDRMDRKTPTLSFDKGMPQGWTLIEGDILMPDDVLTNPSGYVTNQWPGGVVPYEFATAPFEAVSSSQIATALEGMAEWESVANITFRPFIEGFDVNWVFIRNASNDPIPANLSTFIGMRLVGGQVVSIADWYKFTLVHELGHALGFWHQQQRPDRDLYIEILYENIPDIQESANYYTIPGTFAYGPYDYDSIMHYDQCAFSCCDEGTTCVSGCRNNLNSCRTMYILDDGDRAMWQNLLGQSNHLSVMDAMLMSFLYPEQDWRFVDQAFSGAPEIGTFVNPWRSFLAGMVQVPDDGTLWIQPGDYPAAIGLYDDAVTLKAPLGDVLVGGT